MRKILSIFLVTLPLLSVAQFAPPAGQEGTTAMHCDSSAFVAWATGCVVERGPMRIDKPENGVASYGVDADGIGKADEGLVSLGDGGNAVLTFASPICNGPGPDFAVFENPLENAQQPGYFFLELGFVEVSSDGVNYVRFPAISLVPESPQVGSFGCVLPQLVHNLAGKYAPFYGTPFDLDDLPDEVVDKNNITHVRIVDVVGYINPEYASYDSQGHIVNDPWPTPFNTSGFDLDAVGVIHDRSHYSAVDDIAVGTVAIYPNPVVDILSVQTDEAVSIVVYSMTGQKLAVSENNTVDLSILPAGVYMACVQSKGKTCVQKFIKY